MKVSLFGVLIAMLLPFAAAAQASVVGNWQTEVNSPDGPQKMKVTITADGSYSLDLGADGTADIQGKYEMNNDQVTIWEVGGQSNCAGKGVYKYTVDEKTLTMTLVNDPCEGRGGPEGKVVWKRM